MVKLVDMPDLGSGAARRVGSSPIIRTFKISKSLYLNDLEIFLFQYPLIIPRNLQKSLLIIVISQNSSGTNHK